VLFRSGLAEVELWMTARLDDHWDETRALVKAPCQLTGEKVIIGLEHFTGPAVDFRRSVPSEFTFTCTNLNYEAALRPIVIEFLQAHSPFTVGPLMRDGNVVFRTYQVGSGDNVQDIMAFFVGGSPGVVPTPPAVTARLSPATQVVLLIDGGIVNLAFATALSRALQSVGIASLPAKLPQFPDVLLRSLTMELANGHLVLKGEATHTVEVLGQPVHSDFRLAAYVQLLLNNDRVRSHVIRTQHDLESTLFDIADFLSAGTFTRLLEWLVPEAVGRALSGLDVDLEGLSFFCTNASAGGPYADARGEGIIGVDPGGFIVPVEVSVPSLNPVRPPYIRGHEGTREFHVRGCEWGDLISASLKEFPTWQAAVRAGYDGCAHCQAQFSISGYGDLEIRVPHPPGAESGPVTFRATYAGQTVRFGIPLEPEPEEQVGGGFESDGAWVHAASFSHIVPGQWDVTIQRGSWSVSGRVKVERLWRDTDGHTHGNPTEVTAAIGQPGLHVATQPE
jgi:hypothetical protein